MKGLIKTLCAAAAMLLAATTLSWGQAKVYTKKMLLEDFPTKTVKVVLGGSSPLEMTLQNEIASRWRISPYEFCSVEEYEKMKADNKFYFLRLVTEEGVAFLDLSKGGVEGNADRLLRPVHVVRLPIASAGDLSGEEIIYMGAFVDVLQKFTEEAIVSDRIGYAGLRNYNLRKLSDKNVYVKPEEALEKYQDGEMNALISINVSPTEYTLKSKSYHMLISADTHEMFYYNEIKFKGPKDATPSDIELKSFENRHATVYR